MAYVKADERDKGRQALERALALKHDFDGAADARRALSMMGEKPSR
jgi:hypothetical protein